jgi:predicted DNA-binding transcriptional regulator AlpA
MQPSDQPGELLIAADRLASIMNLSVRSIWRLLSAGKLLKPVRIGRVVRWRLSEVLDWINAGCSPMENQHG